MDFKRLFSLLDQLFLMPIYPAREKPIKDVNSENLLIDIALESKSILNKEDDLFSSLKQENKFVLVTIGAGDIDLLINPIKHFCMKIFKRILKVFLWSCLILLWIFLTAFANSEYAEITLNEVNIDFIKDNQHHLITNDEVVDL